MKLRHSVLLAGTCLAPFSIQPATAACVTAGIGSTTVVTCSDSAPNPFNTQIGNGLSDDGWTVSVLDGQAGAPTVVESLGTAISLRNGASITIGSGFLDGLGAPVQAATAVVEGNKIVGGPFGPIGTGPNVIEVYGGSTITIGRTGEVHSFGEDASNGEAINVHGYGNTIDNYGVIRSAQNAAALWFEDLVPFGPGDIKNTVVNHGLIVREGAGDVMGSQASGVAGGIIFENRSGAVVNGNLNFQNGDDELTFFPNSTVIGNISGGAGTNSLTLNGTAGSEDVLSGGVANFQSLTKTGLGRWTLSGELSATDFVSVLVEQGTLALTGNNADFEGEVTVDAAGILEARAQSLPTNVGNIDNILNSGLVRFTQPDTGTYIGQIVGSGAVEKIGAGITILDPESDNTYSGGTTIRQGTLAITRDAAIGAAGGAITFDNTSYGGIPTLRLDNAITLDATRAIAINGTAGGIDTNGFSSVVSQGISGPGGLAKLGAGTLTLTGANSYAGGTLVDTGVLSLGAGGTSGSLIGDVQVNQGAALAFNRSDVVVFDGLISGAGRVNHSGTGTTILVRDNVYTGLTDVQAGTLQIGNGGTQGAIAGDASIAAGATLAFNHSDDVRWGGDIVGTGNLVQIGPGRLDLVGGAGNGFNGNLYVQGGIFGMVDGATLAPANTYVGQSPTGLAGAGTLLISTGAVLTTPGDFIVGPVAGASGTVVIGGLEGTAPAAPGSINTPTLSFGAGDGRLVFNHSSSGYQFDLQAPQTGVGTIAGDGEIDVRAGRTILNASHTGYTGVTDIFGGALQVNGILGGTVNVLAGGRLEGNGFVGSTTNAGTVAPGTSIGALTIVGDYVGAGGILETEVVLGDDTSPTDLLAITGSSTGTTRVDVVNLDGQGGLTDQGIRIVRVDGASSGTFSLIPDTVAPTGEAAVIGGAYIYGLYQGSPAAPADGDWYLRTITNPPVVPPVTPPVGPVDPDLPVGPVYQPGVPLYEAYPQVLMSLNRLSTLQQRKGNRVWSGTADPQPFAKGALGPTPPADVIEGSGAWGRLEGSRFNADPAVSTSFADYDIDLWRVQAGYDFDIRTFADGSRLIGGINVHYGRSDADVASPYGIGSIEATGYGFGGTLTWYGQNGLYVDGQAQATWFDSDIYSDTLNAQEVDGNNGFGYAFSIETGRSIDIAYRWTLTPQAQLVYSNVDFDTFDDAYLATVRRLGGDSLNGRLGLSLDHERNWQAAAGDTRRLKAYGIANLYYEFLDGTEIGVGTVGFTSREDRLWGGLGVGASYDWADDAYSLYGEVGARSSMESFGDAYAFDGTIGFKARF